MTTAKYSSQRLAFASLFVLNALQALVLLSADSEVILVQELQHIYTWLYLLLITSFFTAIGMLLFQFLTKKTTWIFATKLLASFLLTIPVIMLLLAVSYLGIGLFR